MKTGDVVALTFLDHVENDDTPAEFVVYGRVQAIDPLSVTIDSWALPEDADLDRGDELHNLTTYTIVRRAITRAVVFKPDKECTI